MISYAELKNYSKMRSSDDAALFEQGVWDWAQTQSESSLAMLLDVFDDECEFPEVMYSLVHAVETFPAEIYVKNLILKIKVGLSKYPFWLGGLIAAVFNDAAYYELFRQNMHLAPRETLLELFEIMERESPHHRETVVALRGELLNAAQD